MTTQLTPKKAILALLLSLLGAGYFSTFSSLDLFFGLKPMVTLLPIQLGVLIYFLWWKPRKN